LAVKDFRDYQFFQKSSLQQISNHEIGKCRNHEIVYLRAEPKNLAVRTSRIARFPFLNSLFLLHFAWFDTLSERLL